MEHIVKYGTHCILVGWDEFHIIWECEGTEGVRKRVKLKETMGLPTEGEVNVQEVNTKLIDDRLQRDTIKRIGGCIKEIYEYWFNEKESADGMGPQ